MKKLTKTQIARLQQFTNKNGELINAGSLHEKLMAFFNGEVLRLYYKNPTITKRYIVEDIFIIADILEFDVITGNDAPRNSKLGEFIKISRQYDFSIEALNEQLKNY